MLMFKKSNKDNGEKIFRYSIRKYHFGAASVAVAALMFFANGVQAQAPAISSATASDVVAGPSGNSDGNPQESDEGERKETVLEQPAEGKPAGELKAQGTKAEEANQEQELDRSKPAPVGQEGPQVGEIKEREESTLTAAKTAAKSTQGTLEALLANLTLDSMKALHAEVEEGLAKAKAVLENPNATQVQVNEQVRLMEDLIRRVNQALNPLLPSSTVSEEASLTNHGLTAPEGAVTEQATSGKRRKRGNLSQATPAVDQTSPETVGNSEKTETSENPSRQELPTYSNQGDGAYKLKDELEFIYKRLQKEGAEESKIQAAKAAADKFNEAFSKGETINQEDFDAALVDLKKSRDLIEGVLESKYGEDATTRRVTIEPRDGGYSAFRNANYSGRSARAARAGENYSEEFKTARESYFERSGNEGNSPYDKYTYVFFSDRRYRDNSTAYVSEAKKYIKATVTPTNDGFHWVFEINSGHRRMPGNTQVWFTIPSGQSFKINSDGLTITEKSGGSTSTSPNSSSILNLLKQSRSGFGRVTKGTPQSSGVNNRFTINPMPAGSLNDLARKGPRGTFNPYERQAESPENQQISDAKFNQIDSSSGELYYFELANNDKKFTFSFDTIGNSKIEKLDYAVGLRGKEGAEIFLVNQWHSRTYVEAKGDAKNEIEKAKQRKNNSLNQNRNLSSVERNNATRTVNNYANQATSEIENADSFTKVDEALRRGVTNIN
ncbi:YSIRK-type signal peptide-containing protein, partial [Streptococcus sp. 27098_8_76]|uniref:YSIRK-type signal peptide-containing protein n=1 Tax=Streptococcus sp. 27098_8_76 TaxID=3003658 RepID=UPI00352D8306